MHTKHRRYTPFFLVAQLAVLALAILCSVAFFASATGAAAPEYPAGLSFSAAPVELTQHEGTDVTFSLTRNGKPLPNTKLHVADNPAFSHMLTGLQRTNHRGMLVMPNLTAQSAGPQSIEISAFGQSLHVQFHVLPAPTAPASSALPFENIPAGLSPAGSSPAVSSPAGLSPAGPSPAGLSPAGLSPAGLAPAGLAPAGSAGLSSATASSSSSFGAPRTPLSHTLFNATASFLGMPGLSPMVGTDGLRDEGLGFHADGTTRKAGSSSAASGSGDFSGQRAATYALSGLDNARLPWLYDSYAGIERDREGRVFDMGSEYSGLRAKNSANGGSGGGGLGFINQGGSGSRGIFDSVLQRGLSAGMSFANTSMESAFLGVMSSFAGKDNPYGNGKARFSFYLDADGRSPARLQGEGDVLWPLYDSLHTTIYTQFGARSMLGGGKEYGPDRWIGNIGMGQRWFPGAFMDADGKPNSGNWMLGYNAFYDVDITRGHERGGVGLEAQYDWLKVSTNWYLPLSDWKDSTDFDGDYVLERAAQGWDFRVKGYLPFYREIAVTGAFTQWYGDYVGMFGPSKLEKDPRVWSYGIEYTPIPALTAYVNQRQSERGRADTEFGLRFTYNFGMGAEEQFKPSRVAEMRTVHGSRHDFVDRENKIILEYQPKNSIYLEFVSYKQAEKTFIFRVRDGFSKNKVGQVVQVTLRGTALLAAAPGQPGQLGQLAQLGQPEAKKSFFAQGLDSLRRLFAAAFSVPAAHADSGKSYITDSNGLIYVRVDDPDRLTHLQVSAGEAVKIYDRPALTLGPPKGITLTADKESLYSNATAALTLENAPLSSAVTWEVTGSGGTVAGGDNTDAAGKATATFTPTPGSKGTAIVKATANGESASLNITVKEDGYSLAVNPTTLTLNTATDVRFTVLRNGEPLSAGDTVTFTVDPAGSVINLPSGTVGSGGIMQAPTLTATVAGTHTITITARDGKKASCSLTVVSSKYSATSSHSALVQHQQENVTFTIKKDGSPVPSNTPVTVTGDSASFDGLPASRTTNASGQVTVSDLKGTTAGTPTLTLTVDGQNVPLEMTITSAAYSVEASHAALTQHTGEDVTLTVKQNGKAVGSGVAVTITGDNVNFYNLIGETKTTDTIGQVTLSKLAALKTGPLVIRGTAGKAGGLGGPGSTDGTEFTLPLQVHAVGYTVQASHSALTQHKAETVTFTVMRGGKAAPKDIPVSFVSHADFSGLTPTSPATDANGQVVVSALTASEAGAQTLQATVAHQTPAHAVPLTVNPATYSLSASSTTPLVENIPQLVTFTIMRNGVALTTGDKVTFSNNPALNLPVGDQPVLSGGIITVPITATASGSQTVEVTVNTSEGKAQTALAVSSAIYSLSASTTSLTQHKGENVTFTIKQGVNPVPANTLVLFTHNPALPALPGSATATTASGEITVNDLTALASGPQTVEITVGGKKTSVSLDVTPVTYALTANPTSLNQHEPKDVVFTFTRGGSALTKATAVTFAGSSNFLNLPGSVNTAASGTVTVTGLITTAASAQTVTATVDGQTVSTQLGVTPAVYTLTANTTALTQNKATDVTFTVNRGVTTAIPVKAGIPVRFAGNANFQNIPTAEVKTNDSGQVSLPGLVTTAPTGQSLSATVAGQKTNVDFTVTPAAYTVTANPEALIQHKATDVVFTVLQDNVPVRAGVAVTFGTNANFTNLPNETKSTNASGQILVSGLVTTAPSGQSISLTAGGQNLTQALDVTPATYALTPDQSILTQGTAQQVVFTLTRNNAPAPLGVSLTFTPNANITGLPDTAVSTNTSGQITRTLTALTRDKLNLDASVDDQRVSTALGVNGTDFTVSVNPATLTQYKGEDVNLVMTGWGGATNTIAIVGNSAFDNLPGSVDVGAAGKGMLSGLIAKTTGSQMLEFIHPVDGSRAYAALTVSAPEYKLSAAPATGLVKDKEVSVTLTLTRGGDPLPDTVPVTLSGAAFTGLPAGSVNTGGSISYPLTPTAEGSHKITATAEGVSFETTLTVGAAEYALALAAAPTSIKAFESSTLTATVTKNGQPAPDGTVVNWNIASGSGVFTSGEGTADTARTSTTSAGTTSVTMQGTAAGEVKVQASTGTGSGAGAGTGTVTVTDAEYVLSATPSDLTQHQGQDVTLTLTRNGAALANTSVTLNGADFSGTGFTSLPQTRTTDALGKITLPGLTATTLGTGGTGNKLTLTATANSAGGEGGGSASTDFTVTAASYELKPSTTALVQHLPQDVVLTLTRNGSPLASKQVTFSGDFGTLAPQTTDANGKITLSSLTATTRDDHTITATITVDGAPSAFELHFTVTYAKYTLSATPTELTQGKATSVTFTLNRNDAAAPEGVDVTLSDPGGLTISPTSATTDDKGQFTATLTGTTTGDKIVTATTVDGQTANASITVNPPIYTLTLAASNSNPGASASSIVTATLVIDGVPASDKIVTFIWKVQSTGAERGRTTVTTDADGKATYDLTSGGDRLTMTVTAEAEGKSQSTDVQFGAALPSGFIVLAGDGKIWADAGAYCVAQGGKLPLINGITIWDKTSSTPLDTIDGFGTGGWLTDFPASGCWTGTESSEYDDLAWLVYEEDGNVKVAEGLEGVVSAVACVPK